MKYWVKLWHVILDDPKVSRLSDSAYRLFIECILLAGELDKDGLLPPIDDVAWRLRKSETALTDELTHLALAGLVEIIKHENEERWFVSKFGKRQSPSPGAQRVAAFRARKRKEAKEKEQNTDTYTYGNITSNVTNVTHTYDGHEENQSALDVIADICSVVKGENALTPSDNLDKAAHAVIGWKMEDKVLGFTNWWKTNGYYQGRPALKSFTDEFQNYIDGVVIEQDRAGRKVKVSAV